MVWKKKWRLWQALTLVPDGVQKYASKLKRNLINAKISCTVPYLNEISRLLLSSGRLVHLDRHVEMLFRHHIIEVTHQDQAAVAIDVWAPADQSRPGCM
jgi:hypothetical protein